MSTLEQIEVKLEAARKELEQVSGTPTEVYARITGYYNNIHRWNPGKTEEYKERKVFVLKKEQL